MRLIEMHIVLDAHGKIQVSPQLMEALDIQPGDMLSFYFDDHGIHVEGGKKPPYVHASPDIPQNSSDHQEHLYHLPTEQMHYKCTFLNQGQQNHPLAGNDKEHNIA